MSDSRELVSDVPLLPCNPWVRHYLLCIEEHSLWEPQTQTPFSKFYFYSNSPQILTHHSFSKPPSLGFEMCKCCTNVGGVGWGALEVAPGSAQWTNAQEQLELRGAVLATNGESASPPCGGALTGRIQTRCAPERAEPITKCCETAQGR